MLTITAEISKRRLFLCGCLQAAIRSKEPDTILVAKANLAKVEVQEKAQEAISSLRQLVQRRTTWA